MLYHHISNVPYTKRQSFKVGQTGPNRDHTEVEQGGQFICLTTHHIYGGYHQGISERHFAATSERAAKRIFNQMRVFGYDNAMRYLEQQNLRVVPIYKGAEYDKYLEEVGLL